MGLGRPKEREEACSSSEGLSAAAKRHQVGCHRHTLHRCPNAVQTEDPACGGLFLWDWLTPTAVTATATQTTADGRSLHQWRSIQGQNSVELQKVQHSILRTRLSVGLNPRQPRTSGFAHSERELRRGVGAFLTNGPRPKRGAELHGKSCGLVKRACSDTIEEIISSTDEAVVQRKCARFYRKDHHSVPSYTP